MLKKLDVASSNIQPQPHLVLDDPYLALFGAGGGSAPGTPPQTAPDYVLNPLSIFRMARNDIPERHAPENNRPTPSGVGSTGPSTGLSLTSPGVPGYVDLVNDSADCFGPGLDVFCNNLTWDWQPMDTAVGSGMDADGLLPWVGTSYMNNSTFLPPE